LGDPSAQAAAAPFRLPMECVGARPDREAGAMTFQPGVINEDQLRMLLSIEEYGRRIIALQPKTAILQFTDDIIEIHARFGQPRHETMANAVVIWLDIKGNVLSVVEEKYEGPQGVHRPGDTYRKWAVAYLRTPDMSYFAKAEEVEYERMWGLSGSGAVDQVRKHVREHWIS
jgi:hypothetical protein